MENNNFLEGYILRINDDVKNAIEEIKDMETKIHPVYYSLTRHFDDINMHVNYGSSSYTNSQANKGKEFGMHGFTSLNFRSEVLFTGNGKFIQKRKGTAFYSRPFRASIRKRRYSTRHAAQIKLCGAKPHHQNSKSQQRGGSL